MSSSHTYPIGIFDSGLGGLSVWKEVAKQLPHESLLYYADSAHCPYGPRSADEIIELTSRITTYLLEQECKLIVVACNTATAAAIQHLRRQYPVPFVGMEPAVKPAALQTRSGHIGVLATAGTFKGKLYRETTQRYSDDVTVHIQVGKGLVELVEQGKLYSDETRQLLHTYLDPMLEAGVDQVVLGCTHYPFLSPLIEEIVGPDVTVIDPAPAVAKQVQRILVESDLEADLSVVPRYRFATNGEMHGLRESMVWIGATSGECIQV